MVVKMHVRSITMALTLLLSCQSLIFANTMPDQILSYFSDGYHESRSKFISAVGDNGGRIDSFDNPRKCLPICLGQLIDLVPLVW